MNGKVLIFGCNSIRTSIVRQYEEAGAEVLVSDTFTVPSCIGSEIVILTSKENGDSEAESFLLSLARAFTSADSKRPLVHILLQEPSALRRLQVSDFDSVVNEAFEVFPFTMQEIWAQNILARLPGSCNHYNSSLDREPITPDCRQFAHLVVAGFDTYAEAVAIKAAQVAHFPNYVGKAEHPLRTRITIVAPGISSDKEPFIARYHNLFNNSYYRTVNPELRKSVLHHPDYEGRREDFVDVEWEFVDCNVSNPVVVEKLAFWAVDPGRQLTVVISGKDDSVNIDSAIALPDALLERGIPVWVRQHRDSVTGTLDRSPRYKGIRAFGMDDEGYNVNLPVMRMARLMHYFYSCIYASKGVPTTFPSEEVNLEWSKVGTMRIRLSNVCSILTMVSKMRSLGHGDSEGQTFYALTEEEIRLLSKTEHNRWCVERLISGMRVCTDEERAAIRKDIGLKKQYKERGIHLDLCAYSELSVDEKGNDVRFYDYDLTASIPLLVATCLKEEVK